MTLEDVAGVNVNVEVMEGDDPAMIFVHGFTCDLGDWSAQTAGLSGRRRVAVDLPGHGASPRPAEASLAALARVVNGLVARTPGAILIGHSLGCRVIQEAYGQSPDGIAGLVFIEMNAVGGGDARAAVAAVAEQVRSVGVHNFLRPKFEEMFTPRSDPAMRARALGRLGKIDPDFATSLLADSIAWETGHEAILARVRVPVLIIQSTSLGEDFRWRAMRPGMTTPFIEAARRHVADLTVTIVEGTGHFPQIEEAESVNAHIVDFAARVAAHAA